MDSIPEITRPSRQEVDSPRSINTGDRLEGVNYSERSQSSEASSRRISRRESSKKDSHRRHSGATGSKPLEKKKDWKDNTSKLL